MNIVAGLTSNNGREVIVSDEIVVKIHLDDDGTIKSVTKNGFSIKPQVGTPFYCGESLWPIIKDDENMHYVSVSEVLV